MDSSEFVELIGRDRLPGGSGAMLLVKKSVVVSFDGGMIEKPLREIVISIAKDGRCNREFGSSS